MDAPAAVPRAGPEPEKLEHFRASLIREYMELADFVSFLDRELQDIAGFDTEKLLANTEEKERRIATLAALAERRDAVLTARGYRTGAAGMTMLLRHEPAFAASMEEIWSNILRTTRLARSRNETNGRLIASQKNHYESRLATLMRLAAPQTTYGADGRPQAVSSFQGAARAQA